MDRSKKQSLKTLKCIETDKLETEGSSVLNSGPRGLLLVIIIYTAQSVSSALIGDTHSKNYLFWDILSGLPAQAELVLTSPGLPSPSLIHLPLWSKAFAYVCVFSNGV